MIEMTLSSRHRIRNSSTGGLMPSTLPLGHGGSPQYWLSHVDGEETFFVSLTAETGNRTPNSGVKGSGANHYPRAPAHQVGENWSFLLNFGPKMSKSWCCHFIPNSNDLILLQNKLKRLFSCLAFKVCFSTFHHNIRLKLTTKNANNRT